MEFPLQRMSVSETVFEESPTRDEPNGRWSLSPFHPDFEDPEPFVVGQSDRLIPEQTS